MSKEHPAKGENIRFSDKDYTYGICWSAERSLTASRTAGRNERGSLCYQSMIA